MEPVQGVLTGQRPAPVGAFFRDPDPRHRIDEAGFTGAVENRRQRFDPRDLVLRPVDGRRPIERTAADLGESQIGRDVHALGAGVQAVREVLEAPDARDPVGDQNLKRAVLFEGPAQHDAMVDLDVEVVGRKRHVARRRIGEPPAQVHRGLVAQRRRAEHLCGVSIHGEDADLHCLSGDDVRDHLTEVLLADPRRAEPGARRAA